MNTLTDEKIRSYLKYSGDIDLTVYKTTDSTNLRAKEAALMGAPSLSVFAAESQSAGRGRLGRSFYSPTDTGLYMTMLIRVKPGALLNLATIYAGTAVSKAIEECCGLQTKLKWVNDVFVRGKKVCGILAEAVTGKNGIEAIVIGIGVNVKTPQGGFPDEIKDIAGALDTDVSRAELCAAIADELIILSELDFYPEALEYYRARNMLLGMDVEYTLSGQKSHGIVFGIDDAGALLIQNENGDTCALSYGEATIGSKNVKHA